MPGYGTEQATLDQISGTAGIPTWPTAAAYANAVSMAEVLAYIQDAVRKGTGTALGTNESLADVLYSTNGIVTFPASAAPANGKSIAALLREIYDQMEKAVSTVTAATMPQATTTIFTVAGGGIEILNLVSRCVTTNNGNASTLQWTFDGTLGTATTITAASGSLASLVAGDMVFADLTLLTTQPIIMSTGISAALGPTVTERKVYTNGPGVLQAIVGTAATTGTWNHSLRYRPLDRGVTVVAAF